MALQDLTSPRPASGPLDVEQAEAALVEHYPRLVRLGYLVLPPTLGRHRRVLTAHALVQRALPRGRTAAEEVPLPAQRSGANAGAHARAHTHPRSGSRSAPVAPGGSAVAGTSAVTEPAYAYVRLRVLRGALGGQREAGARRLRPRPLPPLLPRVFGLRLFPRSGGADALALEHALSDVPGAARAAYVLRGLEGMPDPDILRTLEAAGVPDPERALAGADAVHSPAGSRDESLLASVEFDPCALQVRPTDLLRRRQHGRAALAAAVAVVICGALLGLPGDTWGPDGAAAPSYARNPAAEKALDPGELTRVTTDAWKHASRRGFSAWPTRGDLAGDGELLRRALAVWARPGKQVQVSATRGTSAGPPPGPPQLLYAGTVDGVSVVLLHDGLRVARYAEPAGADEGGAVLDLARTDGAEGARAGALTLTRSDNNVRYLTAPWVTDSAVTNLLNPHDTGRPLKRGEDGVTAPVTGSVPDGSCERQPALELTAAGGGSPTTYADLGELTPARLTDGAPGATPRNPRNAEARASLARTACLLTGMRGKGISSVNSWRFGEQRLPEDGDLARWVCTRAETWRGDGAQVLAQFQAPTAPEGESGESGGPPGPVTPGAVVARAEDSPACGEHEPHVLSGVRWKSGDGNWYLLAAGSPAVTSIRATGGVQGSARGRALAVPAEQGPRVELTARLADGSGLDALGAPSPGAGDR